MTTREHRFTRLTRQRQAVLRALARIPGFISAHALLGLLRTQGELTSLATVYRTLRVFSRTGWIVVTRDETGRQLFHLRGRHEDHVYYLVCRACGDAVPINGEFIRRWSASTAEHHRFTDIEPVIRLNGVCGTCVPYG
jgi:Fur family ferric uptake transcriptional regulator